MPRTRLHVLSERLASLFRSSLRGVASEHGLKLVQLEALIYLSMANRYSDNPAALTEYLGVTKGTVSQTLKVLEHGGLIEKHADVDDGRRQHCHLTPSGQAIVDAAYPAPLWQALPDEQAREGLSAMEGVLRQLQAAHGFREFGVCRSCRFFEVRRRGGRCGLTQESLSADDSKKICREHEALVVLDNA